MHSIYPPAHHHHQYAHQPQPHQTNKKHTLRLLIHVTLQVAIYQPSSVVTVMTQLPSATYVTNQVLLTVATEVLLLLHLTFWLLASLGVIDAINCSELHILTVTLFLFKLTPVTGIGETSNVQPSLCQSNVIAIVTVHSQVGVTNQLLSTVAILVLLLVQTKF